MLVSTRPNNRVRNTRRSYKELLRLPVWGVYRDGRLVATVRAKSKSEAKGVLEEAGIPQPGDKLRTL